MLCVSLGFTVIREEIRTRPHIRAILPGINPTTTSVARNVLLGLLWFEAPYLSAFVGMKERHSIEPSVQNSSEAPWRVRRGRKPAESKVRLERHRSGAS